MTYQNYTPIKRMGNIFFEEHRVFWCHFTFTVNQLVVILDTISVTMVGQEEGGIVHPPPPRKSISN